MVVVLLTLLALLVLCTPFLMTVRNADYASTQLADRTSAQLALDSAGNLAKARIGASHPAIDRTPYYDSLDELGVTNEFNNPEFIDARDPHGIMFDLEVHDVSGRIDLNSMPPQVIGNLIGGTTVTLGTLDPDGDELRVTTTRGFLPAGFLWMPSGELVGYGEVSPSGFSGLLRSLAVEVDGDGNPLPCGPRPAQAISSNTVVLDQRTFALPQWRTWTSDGSFRQLDSIEQLRETLQYVMIEEMGQEALAILDRTATVYSGVGAGHVWQRPIRIRGELTAGESCTLRVENGRWFNQGTTVRITDGQTTELGVVRGTRGNAVTLMDAVANDYSPFTAVVQPLARRPVNINTAREEVLRALLMNLQLAGRQSRITSAEADDLVGVIVQSRPFTCFEDFVRRVILPAGGWEVLPADAPRIPEQFVVEEGLTGAEAAAMIQLVGSGRCSRALQERAQRQRRGALLLDHALRFRLDRDALDGASRSDQRGFRYRARPRHARAGRAHRASARSSVSRVPPGGLRPSLPPRPRRRRLVHGA